MHDNCSPVGVENIRRHSADRTWQRDSRRTDASIRKRDVGQVAEMRTLRVARAMLFACRIEMTPGRREAGRRASAGFMQVHCVNRAASWRIQGNIDRDRVTLRDQPCCADFRTSFVTNYR